MLIVVVFWKAVKHKMSCREEYTAFQKYLVLALLPGFIKKDSLNSIFSV